MRSLTIRQEQVLRLIAEGMCDKEISQSMGLSPETVRDHAQLMTKVLGAKNRAHAVAIACRMGLIKMEAA